MVQVPGSNLLGMALRLIAPQQFQYYAWATRSKTANGMWVATYAAPVTMAGSVQPVPRTLYEKYGLDFQKNYVIFYTALNAIDIARDVSGDQFIYAGKKYQAESKTDWFQQDGWDAILAVEVPV